MTKFYIREIKGAEIVLRIVLVARDVANDVLEKFRSNNPNSIFDMKEYD